MKKNNYFYLKKLKNQSNQQIIFINCKIIIITFDQILGDLKNCMDRLDNKQYINNIYNLVDELEKILNPESYENELMQFIDEIINQNNSAIDKILKKIIKLQDVLKEANSKIKNSFLKIIKIPKTDISLNLISNDMQQQQQCFTIAFNQTGQIMASGCDNYIRLWNFNNGELKEIQKLNSLKSTVSCLIFSKLSDNFVSGSYDGTIKIWKQFNRKQWKNLQSYEPIIKNETVLISGSQDPQINVWDIDLQSNRLQLLYSLLKHQDSVFSLSLNQSETTLVSSGNDSQIIVWMKTQNNIWVFKQIVNQSIQEQGTKICFIKENQFIWICGNQNGQDSICFFELQNEQYQEQFNQQIKLISNNQGFDYNLFPIMFNKEKKIILIRHKFYIYILSQQFHNKYTISSKLYFQDNSIQGAMTNDANYIVLWEKSNSSYFIYKIDVIQQEYKQQY